MVRVVVSAFIPNVAVRDSISTSKLDADLLFIAPNHLAHSRRFAAVKYEIE
jgi:hypothetical protein